ncbi:hypothetical protein AB4369_22425 [Vibrio sp. 10N.261.49.A5]|uniref:hypothetical protein n=1 Tax=unclassified Vibrio TaxID=2614977 RepID=UPI00354F8E01
MLIQKIVKGLSAMPHDFRVEEQEEEFEEEKEHKIRKLVQQGMSETDARQLVEDEENHDPTKGPFLK